jgi:hypothetical protein
MIEPMPPVVAAIGTPNSNALDTPDLFPSAFKRGMIEATTMAVAAVFDISIDAIIVVVINPISRFLGFAPEIFNVNLNNASSSLVFVIAVARKKPPSMSQITLLAKVVTYLSIFSDAGLRLLFPNIKTRYAIIKTLTANGGTASVNQRPIAKNKMKRTYTCVVLNEGSLSNKVNTRATINDSKK